MVSILNVILECAGHYRGKDIQRKLAAIEDLRKSTLNGHDVLAVIVQQREQPTHTPHFGHDYRCASHCEHDPLPWGVKRYFGITLVVSGDWDMVNYPLRYWVNSNCQIDVTGEILPYEEKRRELREVK